MEANAQLAGKTYTITPVNRGTQKESKKHLLLKSDSQRCFRTCSSFGMRRIFSRSFAQSRPPGSGGISRTLKRCRQNSTWKREKEEGGGRVAKREF